MQASLVQRQQLGLKMSPQMYQSIKLMGLPLSELRETIADELERNPALELVEDRSVVSLEAGEEGGREGETAELFEASSDPGFLPSASRGEGVADDYRQFVEGVPTRPETLQQHLLWQLQLEPAGDGLRRIAATLIQNLDDDGFHREPVGSLFKTVSEVSPSLLEEAMGLVRRLDPAGCCTADYKESLKVQISLLSGDPACMECTLDHLGIFGKESFGAKCPGNKEKECLSLVKKLSPFPGRPYSTGEVRFVVPDIQVVRDGDDFSVILNNDVIPVLGINPFFKKLNPDSDKRGRPPLAGDNSAVEFVRENVKEAKFFINSLAMRNRTLKQVVQALLHFQWPFFSNGPGHLVPLTLNDIAAELGVHPATVSRVVNGKYVQSEWGIFELRRFFTNSISGSGSSGSSFSKEAVKAVIAQMLGEEGGGNLSDNEIAKQLELRGIPLARRTVAKYRKELDLGSSYARKNTARKRKLAKL